MRNIFKFLIIGVFAIIASCDDLNEAPEFSDSDAFVAFEKTTVSVAEDGETLKIPVTLASVSGISESVTYSIIDGTAEEGVNFTIEDESQTLTFDAENRTQHIVVNIIDNPGVYTGDLSFEIQLSDDGVIKPNAQNICEVVIEDLDHPLSKFLGEWKALADSYYFGDEVSWTVTIQKDPEDVTVLWIQNIVYGFPNYGFTYPNYDTRFYGVVNEDKTEVEFPIGQTCAYEYQGEYPITLFGMDADLAIYESGNVKATLSADGKVLTFQNGIYIADDTGGWDAIYPEMTWTKN
ncbi:MAG: Calx-beta domain-containing protein [Thiohalospira sp.]